MSKEIILASTSPRRRQILNLFEIKFKVVDPEYDEVFEKNLDARKLALSLARGKAEAALKKHPKGVIIAADSLVCLGKKIFGKPKDDKQAMQMLKALSGKTNKVVTAVVMIDALANKVFYEVIETRVKFKQLSNEQIKKYVATKEPLGRAGAYALQGLGFDLIEKISGSITGSIGLPMEVVFKGFKKLGIKFLEK
ncbi:MAG: septum formation protein Maf [Candidatus Doudnabacteria bacterium]|nr:septum formation protein Maf [Candidatus Doudnabacteria bacterium]